MKTFWKGRQTFVTGGTGFVGANIVKGLLDLGANVVCLQRDAVQPNSLDIFALREKVTVVDGSVEDYPLLERILNEYEIDAVFHLAAQAVVGAANRSPLSTFETNIRGTYLLLEACRLNKAVSRVVVASSDKAYGTHSELPYKEDFELRGAFPYDVSKSCTDLLSRSFAHTYELPIAVTRSANIYGPGDLNLSRIIPGTILSVLKNENPIVRSDGTPIREFVHVDDVVSGYLTVAEKIDQTRGEAFNIGSNEPVQVLDLVERIIKLSGREGSVTPDILLQNKIEHEIDQQYLSADKLMTQTGWRPQFSLTEGLTGTIQWYNTNLSMLG